MPHTSHIHTEQVRVLRDEVAHIFLNPWGDACLIQLSTASGSIWIGEENVDRFDGFRIPPNSVLPIWLPPSVGIYAVSDRRQGRTLTVMVTHH